MELPLLISFLEINNRTLKGHSTFCQFKFSRKVTFFCSTDAVICFWINSYFRPDASLWQTFGNTVNIRRTVKLIQSDSRDTRLVLDIFQRMVVSLYFSTSKVLVFAVFRHGFFGMDSDWNIIYLGVIRVNCW